MNITRRFIENFAHPSGLSGRIVAWRLDITNRSANEWTLSLLNLSPDDRILEVGFGSGRTLRTAAEKLTAGFAAGVDSSSTMLKIASKKNAQLIVNGCMELKLGDMESIPYQNACFDKVYAVQVINYLPDPIIGLKEMYRVTRPGGRVALFFEAKDKFRNIQDLIDGIYRPYDTIEVVKMLHEAGFTDVRIETREFTARKVRYIGHVATGEKPLAEPYSESIPAKKNITNLSSEVPSNQID